MKTRNILLKSVVLILLVGLLIAPVYTHWSTNNFPLILLTRIVILAIAAVSLNLVMGYGGMVSFGHALYLGVSGYAVGILAQEGFPSALVQWPVAIAASALVALMIGALSLRTKGVYFLMITLAFAQMFYYVAASLERYGADDGMTINRRSVMPFGINLANKLEFYYVCLVVLALVMLFVWRLVNSRFGMVIRGARSHDRRMQAIGFPTYRYRLTCFTIAGAICGLAGVLQANLLEFISPAAMHWTRSGELMIMVALGGLGSLFGPVIGAFVCLFLEESLSRITEYWQLIFGPFLLAVVLFAGGGISGLLRGRKDE